MDVLLQAQKSGLVISDILWHTIIPTMTAHGGWDTKHFHGFSPPSLLTMLLRCYRAYNVDNNISTLLCRCPIICFVMYSHNLYTSTRNKSPLLLLLNIKCVLFIINDFIYSYVWLTNSLTFLTAYPIRNMGNCLKNSIKSADWH